MTHPTNTNLLTPLELTCDRLPAALDGLRVVHVTDTHVRRSRRRHRRLCEELAACRCDLVVMTGDYMHRPAHEAATLDALREVCAAAQTAQTAQAAQTQTGPTDQARTDQARTDQARTDQARTDQARTGRARTPAARPRPLGIVGVFGNHDTPGLVRGAADLPVRWLFDEAWACEDLPLTVLGLHYTQRHREGDLAAALLDEQRPDAPGDAGRRFRLLLAHEPTWLVPGSQAGVDLVFAGHTHGGQIRLPGGRAVRNRLHWPLSFTSGVMRLGRTTAVVSNGLGEGWFDHLRVLCPAHAPLITLRRSTGAIEPDARLRMLHRW